MRTISPLLALPSNIKTLSEGHALSTSITTMAGVLSRHSVVPPCPKFLLPRPDVPLSLVRGCTFFTNDTPPYPKFFGRLNHCRGQLHRRQLQVALFLIVVDSRLCPLSLDLFDAI
jgi:hypothetical protein